LTLRRKDFLLALMFFAVRIEGRTQLQKLTFLGQKEGRMEGGYDFRSWKFGPFSDDIWKDLDMLVSQGQTTEIPQNSRDGEVLGYMYLLSKQGRDYVTNEILPKLDQQTLSLLKTLMTRYSHMSLDELLTYVYQKYPEYTGESQVRDRFWLK
jgi:uncharacterized protein YwgA